MTKHIQYETSVPDDKFSDFIERFWKLQNNSAESKEIIVIPDGRIDLIFTFSPDETLKSGLIGIETLPSKHEFSGGTVMFGVSLKLLSVEYLLEDSISEFVNKIQLLPDNFWGIAKEHLDDFDIFCNKISEKVATLIKPEVDTRKKKLFEQVYLSNGSITVKELSETVHWSTRQINRYFSQKFGLSLKTFCTILRFRSSFSNIKQGKLFPEENFSDQSHFIKEVKKFTGVSPKELFKNQNDRFIQFSVLNRK